jgi:hypothetical protein
MCEILEKNAIFSPHLQIKHKKVRKHITFVPHPMSVCFLLPYFKPLIQTATFFLLILDLICALTGEELIRGFSDRGVWKVSTFVGIGVAIAGCGGAAG